MRLALVAVVLVVGGLVPAASSQLPSEAVLTDPMGDVKIDAESQSASVAGFGPLDLTGLLLTEDPTTFHFEVSVFDLGDDQETDPQSGYHHIHFSYDGYDFRLLLFRPLDSSARGELHLRENQTTPFHFVETLPVFRDAATNTLGADVARSLLVAASGKIPGRGDALTDVHVTTSHRAQSVYEGYTGQASPAQVADSMPDDLTQPATWVVRLGGRDGLGAELTSSEPFRASNGEATTYRYVVNLKHLGATNAFYEVKTESLPVGWDVTLPGDLLAIDAGQTVDFPVFITTPFRHQHGATESATLRVQEPYGDAWASIELGVHYLAIPQPAGHHADQYFHNHPMTEAIGRLNSGAGFGGITGQIMMNTVPEDPTASDAPVYGRTNRLDPAGAVHWGVCLEPQLRLGLDFDTTAVGQVSIPIATAKPVTGAVLKGQLLLIPPGGEVSYCGQDNWADDSPVVLATFEAPRTDLAMNAETLLQADLVPTPESDYIPYQTGMLLVMAIDLTGDGLNGGLAGAGIAAGGTMRLPLLEYHDTSQVQAAGEQDIQDATFTSQAAPAKDSPGFPVLAGLLAVAVALAARRSRQ